MAISLLDAGRTPIRVQCVIPLTDNESAKVYIHPVEMHLLQRVLLDDAGCELVLAQDPGSVLARYRHDPDPPVTPRQFAQHCLQQRYLHIQVECRYVCKRMRCAKFGKDNLSPYF